MKAISVRQPWAWAILNAGKRVENRQWQHAPKYRGPVLIHAAKGCTRDEYEDAGEGMVDKGLVEYIDERAEMIAARIEQGLSQPGRILPRLADLQRGGIVGHANLVDVRRIVDNTAHVEILGPNGAVQYRRPTGDPMIAEARRTPGYSVVERAADPWAIPGALGLILADVVELPFAPVKGMLGLFDVSDEELVSATQIGGQR